MTYLPSSLMKRSGLNLSGSTKCFGSFIMKEMLAMKVEPGGKMYDVVEELVLEKLEELVLELLDMLEEFGRLMVVVAVEV